MAVRGQRNSSIRAHACVYIAHLTMRSYHVPAAPQKPLVSAGYEINKMKQDNCVPLITNPTGSACHMNLWPPFCTQWLRGHFSVADTQPISDAVGRRCRKGCSARIHPVTKMINAFFMSQETLRILSSTNAAVQSAVEDAANSREGNTGKPSPAKPS